jgi:non-ribosomal peptide synthetase component F/thioesterase domain-containing protein
MTTLDTNSVELDVMSLDELLSELRLRQVTLWLEGDRLRYRAAKDVMTPALLAQMKLHKAAILTFLKQATTSASAQLPPIARLDRDGPLPLSFAQQRFWSLHQFEPNSSANNMPVVVRCTGTLDVAALERSLQEVVRRHEVLRSSFPGTAGKPSQTIEAVLTIPLSIVDLEALPMEQRDAEAYRLATEEAHRGFNFADGPIVRVVLFRLSQQQHLLLWNMPCMVCDGASSDVFYQDLTTIYAAFSAGAPSPLAELPIQYVDFAHWQRQWLQGEVLATQLNYWKEKLSGKLSPIHLPYDRPRPLTVQTARGDRGAQMLPNSLNDALTALSQKLGVTLFMTLLAVFEILLYRYSQQEDMLISFASAGRGQVETERLLGFFSNTLILRTNFAGNPTFRECLDRVRQASLEAYTHQDLPFEKLLEELQPEQSLLPLFQVKFALNPPWSKGRGMASVELPDLTFTSLFGYIYHGTTKYDLTLVMREQDEGLGMVFDYNAELFDASTIDRMLGHFKTLLEGIIANPDCRITELPLLTQAEHQLQQAWQAPPLEMPIALGLELGLEQCFVDQVAKTPDAIALVFNDQRLSYQALNAQANQLAHYLQMLGVKSGDRVGICVDRSIAAIVGFLGIVKAGGAYLSIPSDVPDDQFASWLEQGSVSWLLTQSHLLDEKNFPLIPTIVLDTDWTKIAQQPSDNPTIRRNPDQLAYVTLNVSDCNDRTQGFNVSDRRVIQSAQFSHGLSLTSGENILQLAPYTSGIAAFEIWGCLLNGGKLTIAPTERLDLSTLAVIIQQEKITTLWLTDRWFNHLVNHHLAAFSSVRQLLIGGHQLMGGPVASQQVKKFQQSFSQCQLIATYSPASHLPIAAYAPITSQPPSQPSAPYMGHMGHMGYMGYMGQSIYLLDSHLQLVPVGIPGALYVAADGWTAIERRNPCWIENPFSTVPDAYLYPTGDQARYLPNGQIQLMGRLDQQVTIRDFPIDLYSIEVLLRDYPGVQDAIVLAQPELETHRLVGYVVPCLGEVISPEALRQFLQKTLPSYLVPSAFVCLAEFPLTVAGSIDHAQLPAPDDRLLVSATAGAARDDLDLQLTQIWEETLGISPIGIQDNFFDLGGHSLLAVRLFAKIEDVLDQQLALSTLLTAPTIQQQGELIRTAGFSAPKEWIIPLQRGTSDRPPLFCIYGILLYYDLARQIGAEQTVYGIYLQEEVDILLGESEQQEVSALTSVAQVAALYLKKIRTIQPHGPYLLAGESFGGLVAYEMAQQLKLEGETVDLLALFDTLAPGVSLKRSWQERSMIHFNKLAQQGPTYALQRLKSKVQQRLQRSQVASPVASPVVSPVASTVSDRTKDGAEDDRRPQFRRQIGRTYNAKPYPGKVVLFRAIDREPFESITVNPYFGWHKLAQDGVEIYDVPGDHIGILKDPNVRVLTQALKTYLD